MSGTSDDPNHNIRTKNANPTSPHLDGVGVLPGDYILLDLPDEE
jgi:hypothetical protein